ncbi:MAG: phage tail protein [Campylobacteraceae bacterium]|nr:phage tail protein [Campylobacteraceae bacterium]
MEDYKIILTNIGKAKVAAAIANSAKIKPYEMALGDGGGAEISPSAAQTSLFNLKWRAPLNNVSIHPDIQNQIVCEAYVPKDIGGWWVREIGIYDDEGDLIAVGNYPATYKPAASIGISSEFKIKAVMEVGDAAVVTLVTDTSQILATQEWVEATLKEKGGSTIPIGAVSFYAGRDVPLGWVRLDGATYTKQLFPALWEKLIAGVFPTTTFADYLNGTKYTDGSVGFFALDLENERFRVPTIMSGNALTQALDAAENGKYYKDNFGEHFHLFGSYSDNNGNFLSTATNFSPANYKPADINAKKTYWNGSNGGSVNSGEWPTSVSDYYRLITSKEVKQSSTETRNKQMRYPLIMHLADTLEGDATAVWNGFLDALNAKANIDLSNISADVDFVIERWESDDKKLWYRKYKSGRLEQGGVVSFSYINAWQARSITFPTPFVDSNFVAFLHKNASAGDDTWNTLMVYSKSASSVSFEGRFTSDVGFLVIGRYA